MDNPKYTIFENPNHWTLCIETVEVLEDNKIQINSEQRDFEDFKDLLEELRLKEILS